MKRMIALVLMIACLLALPARADFFTDAVERMQADAPARNAALDERFESGHLVLVPTLGPVAGYGWVSISPAGNSGFVTLDGSAVLTCYEGQAHILHRNSVRGVEDEYGNLDQYLKYAMERPGRLLGEEGIVYSPDGRYAAVYNIDITLVRAQYFIDPILIDLSTGEVFLTATYGNKFKDDETGVVTTATFSADGRYFYYMLFGNTAQYRSVLYRYDMETAETELCGSFHDYNYWPTLFETPKGSIAILRDTNRQEEQMGLDVISCRDGRWTDRLYPFDLPMKYFQGRSQQGSVDSGYALVVGRVMAIPYAFQCISPDEDAKGINEYMVITNEDDQLTKKSAAQIRAELESQAADSGNTPYEAVSQRIYHILETVRLSPDGHYALLLTLDSVDQARHLYLVRLDDMTMKEISGLDPQMIKTGVMSVNYMPVIEWNSDTLIINTQEGVGTYRFE